MALVWPTRVHECVELCDQIRLLHSQRFADAECELLGVCRHNEQQRLVGLHRVRHERAQLAAFVDARFRRRDDLDALPSPSLQLASFPSSPPPPPPPPHELDLERLELAVRAEEALAAAQRDAVRNAQLQVEHEQRLADQLRRQQLEQERQRLEKQQQQQAAHAPPPPPPLSVLAVPGSASLTGLLRTALSECFWLPLVVLWFAVEIASDRATTHFLTKAFESENPAAMETTINRVSALFIALQRAVLVAAALAALRCGCVDGDASELLRALITLQWDAATQCALRVSGGGGDCCWLHFVVVLALARCGMALNASVRTLLLYVQRGRVWQWFDTMLWLTESAKSTSALFFVQLLLWPARWRFTVVLLVLFELASIGDALLSVALDILAPASLEEQMSFTVSWWHLANAAWKVVACWFAFSHMHVDGADESFFPLVSTLLLVMMTATVLRSLAQKVTPRRQ